jgi:hypothetical protein
MIVRLAIVALSLLATACGIQRSPDTANLPFAAFGTLDNDVAAANQAAWAFAVPARTANNPVDAARAAAGVDYLAGALSANPRWLMVSPFTKQEMLQGRLDVRRALGISPTAPSQVVVIALLRFAATWQAGDRSGALRELAAPGFAMPPEQTVQVLSNLPYIRAANIASIDAANQMLPVGDTQRHS